MIAEKSKINKKRTQTAEKVSIRVSSLAEEELKKTTQLGPVLNANTASVPVGISNHKQRNVSAVVLTNLGSFQADDRPGQDEAVRKDVSSEEK